MANQVKQFRFYGGNGNSSKNQPTTASIASFEDGSQFAEVTPITQLGIQSLPGTKFYLNNASEPVVIGATGIYELDLDNMTQITSLQFDGSSLATIAQNNAAYLIVDVLYDNERQEV